MKKPNFREFTKAGGGSVTDYRWFTKWWALGKPSEKFIKRITKMLNLKWDK